MAQLLGAGSRAHHYLLSHFRHAVPTTGNDFFRGSSEELLVREMFVRGFQVMKQILFPDIMVKMRQTLLVTRVVGYLGAAAILEWLLFWGKMTSFIPSFEKILIFSSFF